MILTMDIGNTNVKIGVFDGDALVASWRISTMVSRTADEYGMVLYDLLRQHGIGFEDIKDIVISSVAPALNYTIEHMCTYYMQIQPTIVNSKTDIGIDLEYERNEELGSDRIVVSSAAYNLYGGPVVVVDFGTATTFNVVTGDGRFVGGAISPGIKTCLDALVSSTAKLQPVELDKPESVVGKNMRNGMQSGIVYGYAGLVKYMIEKFKEIDGMQNAKVIATGGLSEIVKGVEPELIDVIDRALALKGLKLICDRKNKAE